MRQKLNGEFVDIGIDWITVTAQDPAKIERLRSMAYSLIECQLGEGNFGRPWYQSGYQGVLCGHIQYGERDDGAILRLGSHLAKDYWMRLLEMSDNITRLDLQVTVRTTLEPSSVVHRHYREIQRHRRPFRKPPRLSRICDADGGYTLYTGRKCSDVMGRIYDKESESKLKHYAGCVRYEVQFGGKRARLLANLISRCHSDLLSVARAVLMFFQTRGALVHNLLEKLSQSTSIDISAPPTPATDCSRKLEWLAKAVRPTIRVLINLGLRERMLSALGIGATVDGVAFAPT